MRKSVLVAAVAILCATATSAFAQASDLRWNMTSDQVLSAVQGSRAVSRGETMGAGTVRVRGRDRVGEVDTPTRYFFDETGLSMIEFESPVRRCRDVIAAVVQAHGEPLLVNDQVILRIIIWHDTTNDRRIRLMTSGAGFCDLYHERLAPYRETDLANARAG